MTVDTDKLRDLALYLAAGEVANAADEIDRLTSEVSNLKRAAKQVCECQTQDSLYGCIEILRGLITASEDKLEMDGEMDVVSDETRNIIHKGTYE